MNNFSFDAFINNIKAPDLDTFILGYSRLHHPITCYHIGPYNRNQIFIEGGIHAREFISSLAVFKELKNLSTKTLSFGAYLVPLVNPDGAKLVIDGINLITDNDVKNFLLSTNNFNNDFSKWKANIAAVDLNSNFDALWGQGQFNRFQPAPSGFIGYEPNSEPENIALINFISNNSISGSLSIHTKGEVVYYGYDELSNSELNRDKIIAEELAEFLNYSAEKTYKSVGGFSDYVSKIMHIPAFTIELGNNALQHPIQPARLDELTKNFIGITEKFASLLF